MKDGGALYLTALASIIINTLVGSIIIMSFENEQEAQIATLSEEVNELATLNREMADEILGLTKDDLRIWKFLINGASK